MTQLIYIITSKSEPPLWEIHKAFGEETSYHFWLTQEEAEKAAKKATELSGHEWSVSILNALPYEKEKPLSLGGPLTKEELDWV